MIIFIFAFISILKKNIFKYFYNANYVNNIPYTEEPIITIESINKFNEDILKYLIYKLYTFNEAYNDAQDNSQTYYIKYKTINIVKIIFKNNIAWVLFRGTQTEDEYEQDLKFNQVDVINDFKCHNGFYNIYIDIQEEFTNILQKLNPNYIFCIGHSLGGGILTIASFFLYENYKNNVQIYVIGTPRCCDNKLNKYLKEYYFYKINNLSDIYIEAVPAIIPFYNISYEHNTNKLFYFNDNKGDISDNHSLNTYFYNINNLNEIII
jgi:predicted lipase